MDRLWAPWRIKYIKANKKQRGCIFCQALKSKRPNYVVFKTKYSVVILNTFPYNNGHIMISPIRHIGEITKLTNPEALDLFRSLTKAKRLLDRVFKPQGYNIGINLSRSAGAGIIGHLHLHIVPRWQGDSNFMPVIFETKIISQSLKETHKQLKRSLRNIDGDP